MQIPPHHSLDHKSSPIRAIIFDCDGTLIDSEQFHFLAWQTVFQELGEVLTKEFYIHRFSGIGDFEILKIITNTLRVSSTGELLARKHKLFQDYQIAGIAPIAPTVQFATHLFQQKEKRNLKLGVASGAQKKEILHNLRSLRIDHYFDAVLSGQDDLPEYQDPEGTNKPKPYVYLKMASLLGVSPHECIAIEDSKAGVSSAVNAGCLTIAIPNEYTQDHDLSHAHIKIKSFERLSVDDFFNKIVLPKISRDLP